MITKTCANKNCKHGKVFYNPERHFTKNKTRKDGLSAYCKYCCREDWNYYYKPTETFTVVCGYSKCDTVFKTKKPNKKFCCAKHKVLANYEQKDKQGLFQHQNALRKARAKKQNKANNKKLWTEAEILKAIDLRLQGNTWVFIGNFLKRSDESTANKIRPYINKIKKASIGKLV